MLYNENIPMITVITTPKRHQTGVTLIELLISITIGLVLSAVAAYVYTSVQSSSRNLEAQALRNESANIIFDLIGRDLRQSGFFPAHFPSEASTLIRGSFVDVLVGSPVVSTPAFQQAVFGCSNATFNSETGLCNAPTAGAPDSIVINYFTDDTFANSWEGTRRDCLSQSVHTATFAGFKYNRPRVGGTIDPPPETATVEKPLLVQNVYQTSGLETSTFYLDRDVQTRSLRCAGNNNPTSQPLVQGIEQLRITYGLFDPAAQDSRGFSTTQFYTASQVSALPDFARPDVEGEKRPPIRAWQRVSVAQVCILSKTLDPNARLSVANPTYTDCDDNVVAQAAGDRSIYKLQTRRFAVRNNLLKSYEISK
jgi:type IV pilus assembly protein PilW